MKKIRDLQFNNNNFQAQGMLNNNQTMISALIIIGVSFLFLIPAIMAYKINFETDSQSDQHPLHFQIVKNPEFNFHVYCPIDTQIASKYYSRYIESPNISTDLYVVFVRAENFTSVIYDELHLKNITYKARFYYCGWARPWPGTCQDAQHICTYPGPMFYLPVNSKVTIVWINDVQAEGVQWDQEQCYANDSDDADCEIDAKIIDQDRPQTEGCTFYEETKLSYRRRKVRVSKRHFPISPHLHGLEKRPAFDGNPLSWFSNNGDRGPGYFSLPDSTEYFAQFDTPVVSDIKFMTKGNNMKVIQVENKQPAGTLFYHDHAMKSTKYNVIHGLFGMYVLYNSTAEQYFPKGSHQKYFLFSPDNDGDIRAKPKQAITPSKQEKSKTQGKQTFSRNMTYRFRILNAHYQNFYYNISFGVYSKTIQLANNQKVKQQLNPYTEQNLPTEYFTKINFTVIGTDSALFHEPVYNVHTFNLINAQRIDILIKFDAQNGVPDNFNHVYLICYERAYFKYAIKQDFHLSSLKVQNKYAEPAETLPIDVPFYNLSNIPKSQIAVNRMRPLLNRPETRYLINGHFMMDMGDVDKPQIGTIEDWYIICSETWPHPIHVHLINFQVVERFTLKSNLVNCTMYELDFFRFSNYSKFAHMTDGDLCNYLNALTTEQSTILFDFMSNYNLQSDKRHSNIGMVSGLNVMEPIATEEDRKKYAQFHNCSLNGVYKYICEDSSSTIQDYYKGWKDTVHAVQFTVTVIRIRWASTNYDEKVKAYPYFTEQEDALVQFPGFIYHCHILLHEDTEMMRSFMLTPSDKYLESKKNSSSPNTNVRKHINFHQIQNPHPTEDFWFRKAREINQKLNCPS